MSDTFINKRDFVRQTSKYLKPGVYTITLKGKPVYIVTVELSDNKLSDNKLSDNSKVITGLRREIDIIEKKDAILKVELPEPKRPVLAEPVYVKFREGP